MHLARVRLPPGSRHLVFGLGHASPWVLVLVVVAIVALIAWSTSRRR